MASGHGSLPDPLWVLRVPVFIVLRTVAADHKLILELTKQGLLGSHVRLLQGAGCALREDVEGVVSRRELIRLLVHKPGADELLPQVVRQKFHRCPLGPLRAPRRDGRFPCYAAIRRPPRAHFSALRAPSVASVRAACRRCGWPCSGNRSSVVAIPGQEQGHKKRAAAFGNTQGGVAREFEPHLQRQVPARVLGTWGGRRRTRTLAR
mmetsp:Transcript_49484/g.159790  ORF Transcript_49484/g.159790 Transcript_49484/m.159790 type:complete len:207 (-) Transcript_49484:2611-3231(-)